MKNLKKVSRDSLKEIKGGYGAPISDGVGGWYCPNRTEVICLEGCTPMCMSGTRCKPSACIDPIFN
ncbi:hypothetical protein CLU96_0030 [Chryseobacterium sp. 52]|uniref:bacteriocin-like protein n=1 Tax=Chryseobacterium sp. 52 TaxID=2035213 RepID=UPI000C4ACCE2|nr:hypothetical protein [Chryseobacterium sp. 52]PIF43127.1 hypothetical protein CLU96_0030 [Chryseobacterium sp. 52]